MSCRHPILLLLLSSSVPFRFFLSPFVLATFPLCRYVQDTGGALTLLEVLFQYIPLDLAPSKTKGAPKRTEGAATPPPEWFPVTRQSLQGMAAALYMDVLRVLPACARLW